MLDENIAELYSLGYFRIIYYEIHSTDNEKINLIINVQETPLREFNLGLRWDNYNSLIATANIQLNSHLLPGLRIEDQIQFAGLKKNILSIYYPSRKLNFPLYPFIRVENAKYPYKFFDKEQYNRRYTYQTDGVKIGLGLLLKNVWNTEFEYTYREESFLPEEDDSDKKETISGILLSAQLDMLDDVRQNCLHA